MKPRVLQVLRPLVLQDQVRLNGLGHPGGRWPDTHGPWQDRQLVGERLALERRLQFGKSQVEGLAHLFFFESVAEMNTFFAGGNGPSEPKEEEVFVRSAHWLSNDHRRAIRRVKLTNGWGEVKQGFFRFRLRIGSAQCVQETS